MLLACSTNPGPAIITDGIPNASAAMHDPVSLGVHSPHPPLPDTTASTPSARSRRWNSSFSRRTTPGRGYGPADPISFSTSTRAVGYSARISRFSSGCVTFAMKLPPTSAMVLPSRVWRRGADSMGSTALAGTGDSTSYVASSTVGAGQNPSSVHISSAHACAPSAKTIAVAILFISIPFRLSCFLI